MRKEGIPFWIISLSDVVTDHPNLCCILQLVTEGSKLRVVPWTWGDGPGVFSPLPSRGVIRVRDCGIRVERQAKDKNVAM